MENTQEQVRFGQKDSEGRRVCYCGQELNESMASHGSQDTYAYGFQKERET